MSLGLLMVILIVFNLIYIIALKDETFSHFDEGRLCEFNITSEKNGPKGVIQSPSYTRQYESNVWCKYHFISKGSERVQVIFTDFDLYHPDNDIENVSPLCRGEYDHLISYVELNNRMSEIGTFCGTETPPQLMSSRNQLTLEFIAQTALNPYSRIFRGFQLTYNFVPDFGIHTGVRDPNHGSIYSPNHPGFYPRNTDCHYTFHGKQDEKVQIFFTYFDVEGEPPCDNDSRSDYLEFSNYNTMDLKMSRYCGYSRPPANGVESERNFFNVTFHSNSVFDRTGFYGYYQFIKQRPKAVITKRKSSNLSWSLKLQGLSMTLLSCLLIVILFFC